MDRRNAEASALALLAWSASLASSRSARANYPGACSNGLRSAVRSSDPPLMLMDEPFGALDALTRDQMNIDLQALWRRGEKTVILSRIASPKQSSCPIASW